MMLFLGLIRKNGIDAKGEALIEEFIKKQSTRFDAQRGYYAILNKKDKGEIIPTISQIEARNSVRDKNSDYIIAFLITAEQRKTAEDFLNIFPNTKLTREVVEAQLNDEWKLNQISGSLGTSLRDFDFEII